MPNFPLYVWVLLVAYGALAVPYYEWAAKVLDKLTDTSEYAQKCKEEGKLEEYSRLTTLLRLVLPQWLLLMLIMALLIPAYLLASCAWLALRMLGSSADDLQKNSPEMYWMSAPILPFIGPFLLVVALLIRVIRPSAAKKNRRLVSAR